MSVWAFLFYTVVLHMLASGLGELAEQNKNDSTSILLVLEVVLIVVFIFMGWYQ